MRSGAYLMVAAIAAAGCSGTKTTTETTPQKAETGTTEEANYPTSQGGLTPEQVDSIDAVFRRKVGSLNQCWQDEHLKSGDRKLQGEITFGMRIEKTGKPSNVKILKSTMNNVAIETCAQKEISAWNFPEIPTPYPFSRSVHLGAQY